MERTPPPDAAPEDGADGNADRRAGRDPAFQMDRRVEGARRAREAVLLRQVHTIATNLNGEHMRTNEAQRQNQMNLVNFRLLEMHLQGQSKKLLRLEKIDDTVQVVEVPPDQAGPTLQMAGQEAMDLLRVESPATRMNANLRVKRVFRAAKRAYSDQISLDRYGMPVLKEQPVQTAPAADELPPSETAPAVAGTELPPPVETTPEAAPATTPRPLDEPAGVAPEVSEEFKAFVNGRVKPLLNDPRFSMILEPVAPKSLKVKVEYGSHDGTSKWPMTFDPVDVSSYGDNAERLAAAIRKGVETRAMMTWANSAIRDIVGTDIYNTVSSRDPKEGKYVFGKTEIKYQRVAKPGVLVVRNTATNVTRTLDFNMSAADVTMQKVVEGVRAAVVAVGGDKKI